MDEMLFNVHFLIHPVTLISRIYINSEKLNQSVSNLITSVFNWTSLNIGLILEILDSKIDRILNFIIWR